VEAVVSLIKYILFALEENAFLGHSKPRIGPSTEHSSHQSEFSTSSPVDIIKKRKILTYTQR
jgi:hypothetical protein